MDFGGARGCGAVWTGVNAGSTWSLVSAVGSQSSQRVWSQEPRRLVKSLGNLVMQDIR